MQRGSSGNAHAELDSLNRALARSEQTATGYEQELQAMQAKHAAVRSIAQSLRSQLSKIEGSNWKKVNKIAEQGRKLSRTKTLHPEVEDMDEGPRFREAVMEFKDLLRSFSTKEETSKAKEDA